MNFFYITLKIFEYSQPAFDQFQMTLNKKAANQNNARDPIIE